MGELELEVKSIIRDVPDFPKEGIVFKDITTLLATPDLNYRVQESFDENARVWGADVIVGIDSRGFLYGNTIASNNKIPYVPVRKKGKLPWKTHEESYSLEYGEATVAIHQDALHPGARVLLLDDLLATGGTASAAVKLLEKIGAEIVEIGFLIELGFLNGREKMNGAPINSLITY